MRFWCAAAAHVLLVPCRVTVLQRCVEAAKATFKAIAVAEPRVRGAAKAGLKEALQQRFDLIREAVLARAAAKVDAQLLTAAQQITTVSRAALLCVMVMHRHAWGMRVDACSALRKALQLCALLACFASRAALP